MKLNSASCKTRFGGQIRCFFHRLKLFANRHIRLRVGDLQTIRARCIKTRIWVRMEFCKGFNTLASILCLLPWLAASEESAPSNIEIKAGYFFFTSSEMNDVYDKGGVDTQISGTYSFCHWLRFYSSAEYLQKSGYSLNGNQSTSIWEVPLSMGLQPFIPFYTSSDSHKIAAIYFTLGPRYFFAHVHNHSNYVDREMNQNGLGGFINLGLFFSFKPHLALDLFGEYSYCKLHFVSSHSATQGHTVQVGGLTFGGGLGYIF